MLRPTTRRTNIVLAAGTLAAATCLAIGILLRAAGGTADGGDPLSPAAIVAAIVQLRPWGWSMLGLLILLATPAAGLVATFLELRGQEPRVAWLSVAVLGVLAAAVFVAVR